MLVDHSANENIYALNGTVSQGDDYGKYNAVAKNLTLTVTDGQNFSSECDYAVLEASYTRGNITTWGTLCLPFAITETYDGVTFYSLSEVDVTNNLLTFTPKTNGVAAGEPVVFKTTNSSLEISEENVNVVTSPLSNGVSTVPGWTLFGTFEGKTGFNAPSGQYLYYFTNSMFYQGTNTNIPAYRAYFLTSTDLGSASQAPFRIETTDTEDIQFVEQEDGTVKVYYDIQGRKLDGVRKGLVIENGKIIMVK